MDLSSDAAIVQMAYECYSYQQISASLGVDEEQVLEACIRANITPRAKGTPRRENFALAVKLLEDPEATNNFVTQRTGLNSQAVSKLRRQFGFTRSIYYCPVVAAPDQQQINLQTSVMKYFGRYDYRNKWRLPKCMDDKDHNHCLDYSELLL